MILHILIKKSSICLLTSIDRDWLGVEPQDHRWDIVVRYGRTRGAYGFAQARGGSGAWYTRELTELLPHVARALHINWNEAT